MLTTLSCVMSLLIVLGHLAFHLGRTSGIIIPNALQFQNLKIIYSFFYSLTEPEDRAKVSNLWKEMQK